MIGAAESSGLPAVEPRTIAMISSGLRDGNTCVPVAGRTGRDPAPGRDQWPCVKPCRKPAACKNCYAVGRDRFDWVPYARPLAQRSPAALIPGLAVAPPRCWPAGAPSPGLTPNAYASMRSTDDAHDNPIVLPDHRFSALLPQRPSYGLSMPRALPARTDRT